MADLTIVVEWLDGEGETRTAPYPLDWSPGMELPKIGDDLQFRGQTSSAWPIVGRRWSVGGGGDPVLTLVCDVARF